MSQPARFPVRRAINPLADHEVDLTWKTTRQYMRADFERFLLAIGDRGTTLKRVFWRLLPNVQAVMWYRVSRYLYVNGWRSAAMLTSLCGLYLTRAELPGSSSIGPGCLLGHAVGVVICGRVGRNFTMYGQGGIGGGVGNGDVGGGPGLPCVGDDVTLAFKAMVLGPVRVGDGARFAPAAVAARDVPAGAVVVAAPSRIQSTHVATPAHVANVAG